MHHFAWAQPVSKERDDAGAPLSRRALRALGGSRLVHFVVLGGALFALAPRTDDGRHLRLSSADLKVYEDAHAAKLGGIPLSSAQRAAVDSRAVEDEILFREATRLGLDRGDTTLRQHLIVKALLFAEDLSGASRTPTEADLRAFFEATKSTRTVGATAHFVHVFASHHDDLVRLLPRVRALGPGASEKAPDLGEPLTVSRDVATSQAGLVSLFGDSFARRVFELRPGEWSDPIESKLGWHTVKILALGPGRQATYDDVKRSLVLEWETKTRHEAVAHFLERAYSRYKVEVDGAPFPGLPSTGRLGRRADPSAED